MGFRKLVRNLRKMHEAAESKDAWAVVRSNRITVAQGYKCSKCGLIRSYQMSKCPKREDS